MDMAASGHVRVARVEDIPDGGCLAVDVGEQSLVLIRRGDQVHALENRCPHAGAPLSEGFVEGRVLTCAWHGWSFDVVTGLSTDETEMAVPIHDVRVEDGHVFVKL